MPVGRYLKLLKSCVTPQITTACKNEKELSPTGALVLFEVSTSDLLEQLTESELELFNYFSFRYAV